MLSVCILLWLLNYCGGRMMHTNRCAALYEDWCFFLNSFSLCFPGKFDLNCCSCVIHEMIGW